MYEASTQTILRCGQCNKPFEKQSTLKRHGYYCRSRRIADVARSRSCASCVRRKARCDNTRPKCSRCTAKGIECHYLSNTPKASGPETQQSDDAPILRRRRASPSRADPSRAEHRQETIPNSDVIFDTSFTISDPEFANFEVGHLDWDVPDINFANSWNPDTNDEPIQYPSTELSPTVRHSIPSTSQRTPAEQAISFFNESIPPLPTHTVRALVQRQGLKTGVQRIVNLLLHTLKSYPLMMLRHDTLPPFIHPHLVSSNIENKDTEPLSNCISLLHIIGSGIQSSRKLFWKNVRLECERFCVDHLEMNKWELLAAMQALSIYTMIRLDEGETEYNNVDALLIAAIIAIGVQLNYVDSTDNANSVPSNPALETGWQDWIFEESRRRLCVIYRVVNMLIYFEPAGMCDLQTDLIISPLPAKKQLWEAGDELVWKAENEREPEAQITFALAANGELVKLDGDQFRCSDQALFQSSLHSRNLSRSFNTAKWEEWCSGMDGIGGLVMLAASLVG